MSLDLYLGPMFAGKSSAILGVVRRNEIIGRSTLCITSCLDTRYSTDAKIVSHNKESYPAVAMSSLMPALKMPEFTEALCVVVEEAQFFPDLLEFTLQAVEKHKKHVICVGLDGDSERKPFGQLLDLIPFADNITKFKAYCMQCRNGKEAIFTFRKPGAPGSQIAVGGQDTYEPLCRTHYLEELLELKKKEFIKTMSASTENLNAAEILQKSTAAFGMMDGIDIYRTILDNRAAITTQAAQ